MNRNILNSYHNMYVSMQCGIKCDYIENGVFIQEVNVKGSSFSVYIDEDKQIIHVCESPFMDGTRDISFDISMKNILSNIVGFEDMGDLPGGINKDNESIEGDYLEEIKEYPLNIDYILNR